MFKSYVKKPQPMRHYVPGEDLESQGITVNPNDREQFGSPKAGDMIARNPDDHSDTWLVSREQFERLYLPNPID